ncbi:MULTISPECIES: LysR family transcriptional regulator [unclassified Minwuia]|jgi:DNA-binding transcriptional LysR family regulator|uniref:LysR family transcriptional regulator n=1 Tax=unclassified Minwuia TaxID=2618799 RepID=UPI00247AF71E|nr:MULTISPECIES: LysR family transcriptional regulator [unclassified Minwuia]
MEFTWDTCRSFLAVLRTGSLSAAARQLGLTQPTIGRHVDQLEQATGAALFTRARNGLTPTATALALRAHAEAMEAAAAAMIRASSGAAGEARGTVRLTVSQFVGSEVMPPMLARFRDSHPEIDIELVLSDSPLNLLTREADIAIRMARPSQTGLVARMLGSVEVGLFAHRDYLDRFGTPTSFGALKQHRVIGYDTTPYLERAMRHMGLEVERDDFAIRVDTESVQVALIRSGFGIGGCQVPLAAQDPGLVRVLPDVLNFRLEVWRAMHGDMRDSLPVRLMAAHLDREFRAYLRGATPPETGVGNRA